jgi:hypothetical protein
LHYAAVKGFTKGVKLLLEHHADVNLRTPADQTALLVALQAQQPHKMKDTVLALLEHEATDLTAVVPTTKASLLTLVDRMLPGTGDQTTYILVYRFSLLFASCRSHSAPRV